MEEFKHIMFYEEDHKYINMKTGERYESVTQRISKFKKEVNWDYWAAYKHLKELGPVRPDGKETRIWFNGVWKHYSNWKEEIQAKRAEWKLKGDIAATKGTAIHLYLENLFNNKVIVTDYNDCLKGANKYYEDHKHLKAIYPELIVGDDDAMIAGQVDRPFEVGKWLLSIHDFKTDAEIKTKNKFGNLKKPYDKMPDCNFSKYTIQLNYYRSIIEKNTRWKIRDLKIVHLTCDSYTIYDIPKIKIHDIR